MEPTVPLALKPDAAEATSRWLAFWDQELIDRPCCVIRTRRQGVDPVPGLPYMAGARDDFRGVAERALAHAESIWWGGEAMPSYTPSFGPDMFAAWLGAELCFDESGYGTSWVEACVSDWDAYLPIILDESNEWWTRMRAFCSTLAEVFDGRLLVTHLDLHSNMDALAALREPAHLCMDMMDIPETVSEAMRQVRGLYAPVYDTLYRAARMDLTGTCGWVPAYHPVRTNTIQCDFAALIGPAHFRQFVLPALEEEAAYLGHCVYHLDGPECLVHVDDLCGIDHLDCIQWTTGARNKPFIEWLDLLKAIQAKGKSVWVPCTAEDIRIFHRELDPSRAFYVCSAPDQAAGERVLDWLAANT